MPIYASEGEKNYYKVTAGTHQAVCFNMWDIGLQKTNYQGQEKIQHKIILGFEVNELIPEGEYQGKRACIYKKYTLSLSDKANLRKDLESWRSQAFTKDELKKFDVEKLVGVNCMLSIVHSEDGKYANIKNISKAVKGLPLLVPENERTTPDWIKKLQDQSIPIEATMTTKEDRPSDDEEDTEIPF